MKGIFISYRRDDAAGYAGRLYDRLAAHFGRDRVFMDVQGIEPGVDFVDAIEGAVASCEVLIVIIGKDWLAADAVGKRRLDDPGDFVRIETAAALARNIRVVPVLVDDAEMPRAEQLPGNLALLARRQAVELSHKQWDATSSELIRTLEKFLNAGKQRSAGTQPPAGEPSNESPPEPQSVAGGSAPVAGAPVKRIYWGIGAVLAALVAVGALFLTQPWSKFNKPAVAPAVSEVARPTAKSPEPAPSKPAAAPEVAEVVPPIAKRPEPAPQRPVVPQEVKPEPPKAEAPKTEAPRAEAPKAEVQAMPPKILNLEVRGAGNNVQLCYGVQNAASATITPTPGNVKPVAKECVPVTAGTTYTLTARNAAGIAVSRTLAVEAAASPPPAQLVAVPNAIGKSRADAVAELEKAGLEVRIVEDKLDPKASGPADSVVAQLPKGGEQLKAGGRVTLQVMPAQVVVATVPSTLPRAGDVWEYRSRSMWKNVEPRNYTHQINSVSEREVRETMSNTSGPSESKSITPDTRFVEWRGSGYYFIEFNPFIQAFGALQPGTSWQLKIPVEDPMYWNWYTHGRAVNWDSVTVPAGTFKALRVEINSNRPPSGSSSAREREPVRILQVIWYAPDAKRTVKQVRTVYSASGDRINEDTSELVKYRVQ